MPENGKTNSQLKTFNGGISRSWMKTNNSIPLEAFQREFYFKSYDSHSIPPLNIIRFSSHLKIQTIPILEWSGLLMGIREDQTLHATVRRWRVWINSMAIKSNGELLNWSPYRQMSFLESPALIRRIEDSRLKSENVFRSSLQHKL